MHKLAWDDLRFFLAVADGGSLAAAARALGVNHTTVLRRIGALEAELGLRLFDRLPSGYAMTGGGESLLEAARQVEATVTGLERKLAGQDLRLEGELRVTTTDTLALTVLMSHLAGFRAAYPGVTLEVLVGNALANLGKRDADVAIRPTVEPPENLVGRRVAGVAVATYAARGEARSSAWIGPEASLAQTAFARWLRKERPEISFGCRIDSLMVMRAAAIAGLGQAVLPCYIGDTAPELVRTTGLLPGLEMSLWLLTHEDLRRTARVQAFMAFMASGLEADRPLFEGRRPIGDHARDGPE